MKNFLFTALAFSILVFTAGCDGTNNTTSKTDNKAANDSTRQELTDAAKEAYIFAYPVVMMYRSMYLQALDPESGVGMGNWLHLGVSTPEDTTIVTPNNDSPYSYAWVDLRSEPYVLTLPKIEKNRFYTSQWDDLFGYVLDNAGSVNDGNDGVSVMLVSPDYTAEDLPKGINRTIKGDSYILGTLTRTQLINKDDLANVKRIQKEYKLQPLSEYLGNDAAQPAPKVDWMKWKEGAETGDDFWKFAGFVSQFLVKNPDDQAKWDALAKFGFEKGGDWDVSKLDENQQIALRQGQKDALKMLQEKVSTSFDPKKFFNNREGMKSMGDDQYIQRDMGVMAGIFGNTKDVSVYYGFQKDVNGNVPDASKAPYTLTFKAGELPKVKNFWSITMYRLPQRWYVKNELDRYSIGSASKDMKKNKDGSLTIYLQPNSPGADKKGNWLPTPDGPFWIVLRCYGPDQSVIDGTWPEPTLAPQPQN